MSSKKKRKETKGEASEPPLKKPKTQKCEINKFFG